MNSNLAVIYYNNNNEISNLFRINVDIIFYDLKDQLNVRLNHHKLNLICLRIFEEIMVA